MTRRAVIRGVGHITPDRVVTNAELASKIATSDEWIAERTGIRERRWVTPGTSSSQLGVEAAERALAAANISADSIDLIVASTLSPDFYFPGIGVLIQNAMKLSTIPALDIRAQCSGLVYGLSVANAYIRSGQAQRILLVCAEVQSPVLDLTDHGREMAVLFGDGAGALVIEAVEDSAAATDAAPRGIVDSFLGGDGAGAELLLLRSPGTRSEEFVTREMIENRQFHPAMDGRNVFKHAVTRMCETAETLLRRNNLRPDAIDLVIPHQANLRINEAVRERLGLPPERAFNNIHKYGNTTSATIPIAMSEAVAEGRLREGMLVMTLAFGAGFTWGGNIVRW